MVKIWVETLFLWEAPTTSSNLTAINFYGTSRARSIGLQSALIRRFLPIFFQRFDDSVFAVVNRFMSQVYALGAKVMCNSIAGLVTIQRQICRENPDVMISVGKGAKLGIFECQYQFLYQRWNCSTAERDASLFGKVMRGGKKTFTTRGFVCYFCHLTKSLKILSVFAGIVN